MIATWVIAAPSSGTAVMMRAAPGRRCNRRAGGRSAERRPAMAGYPLARTGGLPTDTEWRGLWNVLSDVHDDGLNVAFARVIDPLIAAYESGATLDWTAEELGMYSLHVDAVVEQCEALSAKASRLQNLREAIGEVIYNQGSVENAPPFNQIGGSYVPQHVALEQWGLAPDAS